MNASQNVSRFASLSLAAVKAVSDATNATRYVDKAIGLFSSLCGRVGAFIAQQRDYSAYCQSESQGIECRTQAPAHNTLTSVAPTLTDADIVPASVVRVVRKPAVTATPRKRTTRKTETVAIAANAGIAVDSVKVGPTKYTRKGLECLTMTQLREIASPLSVKGRSKEALIAGILEAQKPTRKGK